MRNIVRLFVCGLLLIVNNPLSVVYCQEAKLLPYGDMDQWIVRKIKESGVIGGNTKYVYAIGPTDTVVGAIEYKNQGGSPWATSNVLAKVSGVVKTNNSVFPEKRGEGWCARLETRYESVKVLGLINIEVIAAGSVFLGAIYEPIKGTKDAQRMLQSGIPFTKKPKAICFDYQIKAAPEKDRVRSTGFSRKTKVEGKDSLSVMLLLQKRWEDKDGNVYAKRIGTIVQRYAESTAGWINGATYPVLYGDITALPEYQSYMRLQEEDRYTLNSKGESVMIRETGWGTEEDTPTHLFVQFASSHGGAYIGSPGNTLWIDNVKLVY